MDDDIHFRVEASAARRFMAVGMQAILGAILLFVAFDSPPDFGWQVFLVVLGAGSLWMARKTYLSTQTAIELRKDGVLVDTNGEEIVNLDDVSHIARGMLALKPTNGFMIHLKAGAPTRWRSGMWWRFGRRIGVGGATPGQQTRALAQIVEMMLVERQKGDET
jgi:hypothetical protein